MAVYFSTLYKYINSSGKFSILVHTLYELLSIILTYILIYTYLSISIIDPQNICAFSSVLQKEKEYYYKNINLMASLHT